MQRHKAVSALRRDDVGVGSLTEIHHITRTRIEFGIAHSHHSAHIVISLCRYDVATSGFKGGVRPRIGGLCHLYGGMASDVSSIVGYGAVIGNESNITVSAAFRHCGRTVRQASHTCQNGDGHVALHIALAERHAVNITDGIASYAAILLMHHHSVCRFLGKRGDGGKTKCK